MPKMTQEDILGHPDYQHLFLYKLLIHGTIPGVDIGQAGRQLDSQCLGFTTPDKTFTPILFRIKGMPGHTSGYPEYSHVTPMQFVETTDGKVVNFVERWGDLLFDPVTGQLKLKKEYMLDVTLQMLDGNKNPTQSWLLRGCFPQNLPGAGMSGEANDVYRPDFNLNWLYYTHKKGGSATGG